MTSFLRNWPAPPIPSKGSIIPVILPNTLILGGLSLLVSFLHQQGLPLAISIPSHIFEWLLGLLLIFWVNAAYQRFLEGQRCWGILVNTVRNLAQQIWLAVEDKEPKDRKRKAEAVRMLAAFAVTTKLYLRRQPLHSDRETLTDVKTLVSGEQYQTLVKAANPPMEVAFWIGDYLQLQHQRERLNLSQLTAMVAHLDTLVEILGDSNHIVSSSFSATYVIYLRQMLLLYCFLLPFQFVEALGWATAPIVMVIGFIVLGTEAIGRVLEHPFSPHPNVLPLDERCQMLVQEINRLVDRPPLASNQTSIKMTMLSELPE